MVGSHVTDHGGGGEIYLLTLYLLHLLPVSFSLFEKNHLPLLSLFPLDFSTPNLSSPQNEAIRGTAFKAAFLCPIPA